MINTDILQITTLIQQIYLFAEIRASFIETQSQRTEYLVCLLITPSFCSIQILTL